MNPTYGDEDKIIWLRDRDSLARMKYVRERWQPSTIRTGPVKAPQGEILINYAVLKKTAAKAEEEGFCRRSFTLTSEDLQPGDRFCDPKGALQDSVPPEAIDPISVKAGKPSRRLKGENKK